MRCSAVKTLRALVARRAMGADSPGLEGIKRLLALPAAPVLSDRRRHFATRAHKSLATRQFGETHQVLRMPQSAPTIHQHEDRYRCVPYGTRPDRKPNESSNAGESGDSRRH